METFHGSLGASFLQRIDDHQFECSPVIERPDPEKVHQREKFLDLVLTTRKLRALAPNEKQILTWVCQ